VGVGGVTQTIEYRLGIALALGLLVGVERERRKGQGGHRTPAGIRTFAIVTLLGAVAALLSPVLTAIGFVGVAALAALGFAKDKSPDPGATTEVALLVMFLVGSLTMRDPSRATVVGITVAVLLAARERLHRFVRDVLTAQELADGLALAAAALIVLPLLPDRALGPFSALNPRMLWRLVVLVMAIGAGGHVLSRGLGPRAGLPVIGFASGFVSGTAAIGSMGAKAKESEVQRLGATSGAVFSIVSTFIQLGIVTFVTSARAGRTVLVPIIAAAVVSTLGALFIARRASKTKVEADKLGRAFEPKAAIGFALAVGAMLLLAAALRQWLGATGILVGAALTGFADAHMSAIAVAALVANGKLEPSGAMLPILVGTTTNCVSKVIVAWSAGGEAFAKPVIAVVLAALAACWAGALLAPTW